MKKASRVTLIVIVSIFTLILLAGFIAPIFLQDYVHDKLTEEFSKQTNQQYQLKIANLDLGIWSRSLSADSISVEADSGSGSHSQILKNFEIQSVDLDGIRWLSLFRNDYPEFASLSITEPKIELYSRDFSSTSFSGAEEDSNTNRQSFPIFDFHLKNASFKMLLPDGEEEISVDSINMDALQLNVQAFLQDSVKEYVENLDLSAKNLSYYLKDQLYRISAGAFNLNNKNHRMEVTDFAFRPELPKYEFSKARGYQLDRYDLTISEIELKGFDLDSLPSHIINLDTLIIRDGWFEVFRDKHKPKAPGFTAKPLVNDMAKSINFPIALHTAIIGNSTIIYEEHNPPSEEAGHISFNKLNAVLEDFRSASHPAFQDDTLTLYVETHFMDAAKLTVDVVYPVFREDDTHYIKTHLASIDPQEVSEMLENVGFVRVESGMVQELSAEMELNDSSSTGELKLIYNDLEVSFLNEDDPERNGIKEKVTDFVTNTFVIKSENPENDPRIGEINHEKDAGKSIFAYWWRSLLSGMENSIK